MDYSLIAGAMASINIAKDIGRAAIGVRDFNTFATAISNMNDQLLKAQDSLFVHNSNIAEMQQQNFEMLEKIRKMEKLLADRGSYELFELAPGNFAYRSLGAERQGHDGNPIAPQPQHYVCQRCFDKGVKSILCRSDSVNYGITQYCSECKAGISIPR